MVVNLVVHVRPRIPVVLTGLTRFAGRVRASRDSLKESLDEIIIPSIDRAFETESDPVTGEAWAPLSDVQVMRDELGARGNPILQMTGELRRHATMKKYWHFEGQRSMIGMFGPLDPPQWALQQFGGTNMGLGGRMGDVPARPYLGVSDEDIDRIGEKLQEYALLRGLG